MLRRSAALVLLFALVVGGALTSASKAQDPGGAKDITAYLTLCQKYFAQGKYEQVELVFEQAYSLEPSNPHLHYYRGRALTKLKRYEEAEAVLDWVQANLDVPYVRWAQGELFLLQGKWKRAISHYEASLTPEGKTPLVIFFNLATAWWRLGHSRNALRYLKRAQALAPSNKQIADNIARLEREMAVEGSFKSVTTDYFVLSFQDTEEQREIQERMGRYLETALADVASDLWYPEEDRFQVVLYPGGEVARKATGAPEWVRASYDGKLRIPVKAATMNEDELLRTLRHELTHLLLSGRFGTSMPGWLNEGVAQVNEGPVTRGKRLYFKTALASGKGVKTFAYLEEPSFMKFGAKEAMMAYCQSLHAILFIKERWYGSAPVDILSQCTAGKSVAQAVKEVTGLEYREFTKECLDYWRERYGLK